MKSVRHACVGLAALAAVLVASVNAVAEPVRSTDQPVVLHTAHAPRSLAAVAEGPTRVGLSWQAPLAADASAITGYGIQFSDDGGATWSVLPSIDRRSTSFVHAVGIRPQSELLYRVFTLSVDGAGPAAVVSASTPGIAMPRIVDVIVSIDQGTTRWYPPRRDIVVTVQFDQAVAVNTKHGAPKVVLVMGRPPHRQSGYLSDYSGGSGTDQLTFRYSAADWNQDVADIEVGTDAVHRNGARITNVVATHSANLAHGPATLDHAPQVDTRSDSVLVMDSHATTPAPVQPAGDRQHVRNGRSGSPPFAAMLTAASALVAGAEIVQQLASVEGRPEAQRSGSEQFARSPDEAGASSPLTVAVELGEGVGRRAASTSTPSAPFLYPFVDGQSRVNLQWSRGNDLSIIDYLVEVSDDGGETWTNLLGTDDQGNDRYHPASTPPTSTKYRHEGLPPGSTRHYRVTARNSNGLGATSSERSVTTRAMVPVAACTDAFWSTEITVGSKQVFEQDGYWSGAWGSIADADFTLGSTNRTVHHVYVNEPRRSSPDYHFGVSSGFSEAELEDLTLHVGAVALPLGNANAASQQSTYYAYRWTSADYADTFGYPPVSGASYPFDRFEEYSLGDKVTVCLVDATPRVTLTLDPASVSENAVTSTVAATVSSAHDAR